MSYQEYFADIQRASKKSGSNLPVWAMKKYAQLRTQNLSTDEFYGQLIRLKFEIVAAMPKGA